MAEESPDFGGEGFDFGTPADEVEEESASESRGDEEETTDTTPVETGGDMGPTGDPDQQTATSGRDGDDDEPSGGGATYEGRERGGTGARDDDDDDMPVQDEVERGDRPPQTGEPPEDDDEPMPAEQEAERGDMPRQTGPTGPTEEEGVEETGETVEQGVEETGEEQPKPPEDTATFEGGVSQADIRQALEEGKTIANVEEKPAVAAQLERMGATDIREADLPEGVDVDLTSEGFETRVAERDIAQRFEEKVVKETGLTEEDVAIKGTVEEVFKADISEQALAEQAEEQAAQDEGITSEDIAIVGSAEEGFQAVFTEEAQTEQRAERVESLAEQAESREFDFTESQLRESTTGLFAGDQETTQDVQEGVAEQELETQLEEQRSPRIGASDTAYQAIEPEAEIDKEVLEAYQGEAGVISQGREEKLKGLSQDYESYLEDVFQPEGATGVERFARKGGKSLAGIANIPGIAYGTEQVIETAQKTPGVVEEEGLHDTVETFQAGEQQMAESLKETAREDPYGTAGAITGEVVGGFAAGGAAFKATEKVGDVGRAARLSTKADVDLGDITTKRGTQGELPRAKTDPDAPVEKAVQEVETRAYDNPELVTEGTGGEGTLFHGTQSKFGREFETGEGASELPGLFGSPEASPIALEGTGTGFPSPTLKPRLPKVGGKSDRFLGLPGDEVDAIPKGRGGSGYALREGEDVLETGLGRGEAKAKAAGMGEDVDVAPDPTTSGYEFLTEGAEEGTAYVRPSGQRTTELEAIFPPGSEFEKTGQIGVRVGRKQLPGTDINIPGTGRKVPLDLFERKGGEGGLIDEADLEDLGAGETKAVESIADDLERLGTREGSPTAGGGYLGGGTGFVGETPTPGPGETGRSTPGVESETQMGDITDFGPSGTPSGRSDMEMGPTDIKSPIAEPSSTGLPESSGIGSGPTDTEPPATSEPSGAGPSDTPTTPPTTPPSDTPTTPPTTPPSDTPTTPPTTPPSDTPTTPPSRTPSTPPSDFPSGSSFGPIPTPNIPATKPPRNLIDSGDRDKKEKKEKRGMLDADTDLFENIPDEIDAITNRLDMDSGEY